MNRKTKKLKLSAKVEKPQLVKAVVVRWLDARRFYDKEWDDINMAKLKVLEDRGLLHSIGKDCVKVVSCYDPEDGEDNDGSVIPLYLVKEIVEIKTGKKIYKSKKWK